MLHHYYLSLLQSSLVAVILWTVVAYLAGSIPFAYLLTKSVTGSDIRTYGDGNTGAYNAWQVGGWKIGVLAIVLDVGKGFLPVLFAQQSGGLVGWQLIPVALAPILAHAYSPILHFRKAKAVAATLGVWLGLTGLPGIISFALMAFIAMGWVDEHAWVVIAGMSGILLFSILIMASPWLILIASINLILLSVTHRKELLQPVHFHNRVGEFLVHRRNSL